MKFLGNMDIHLRNVLHGIRDMNLEINGKDTVIMCMPDLTIAIPQYHMVKEIENINM